MPSKIHVHLLPGHFEPESLRGGVAVVVDVLRASTTILTALRNGASEFIPCLSVEDATAQRRGDSAVLLGGERGGTKIDGFDLSNSPAAYDRDTVEQQTIAFTTTNGTRALLHSAAADQILIGAFVNTGRLAEALVGSPQPLHIVCAGTDGEVTGEDALFAGCLTDRILALADDASTVELSDTAAVTLGCWRYESAHRPAGQILRSTRGGRNLMALSFDSDIDLAAAIDACPILAAFDASGGRITVVDSSV